MRYRCVIKLEETKQFQVSAKHNVYFYFYFDGDDMFRPIDHHHVIFTELRISCMQCK